jgi:hypothetical protein
LSEPGSRGGGQGESLRGTQRIAGITFISLRRESVYLAVTLDAFRRRGIGWALARSLFAQILTALHPPRVACRPPPLNIEGLSYIPGTGVLGRMNA